MIGDHPLVGRVRVRVDQAHADGFDAGRAQLLGDHHQFGFARHLSHYAVRRGAFADLDNAIARHRRGRELDLQVVHVVSVLVADQQRVAETSGGNDAGTTDLAFDQCVRDQGRGVNDRGGDVRRLHTCLRQQLPHSGTHTVERGRRRRERLVDHNRPRHTVEQDHIGERTSDVDGHTPVGTHNCTSSF